MEDGHLSPSSPAAVPEPAVRSPDEEWEKASWVTNLKDPAVALDRLHETFTSIVLDLPATDAGEEGDDDAAEDDDEESEDLEDDMGDAMKELEGGSTARDEDEGSNVFSNLSDNEDEEEEQLSGDDEDVNDFSEWINGTLLTAPRQAAGRQSAAEAAAEAERALEVELRLVGVSDRDLQMAADKLPERLAWIALSESRPGLGPKRIDDGTAIQIPIRQEAVWILRQLQKPGQVFHTNALVARMLRDTYDTLSKQPLILAIEFALEKMLQDSLEPAYLMLYQQDQLLPLLATLWHTKEEEEEDKGIPNPSYAYCMESGRRQKPIVKLPRTVYNPPYAEAGKARDIGTGDPKWTSFDEAAEGSFREIRHKPCFLELGRLLVNILDLDVECHRLEHMRQVLILRLQRLGSIASEQVRFLEDAIFEHVVEAEIWASYVTFLATVVDDRPSNTAGATKRLQKLGLEDAFQMFALTGMQYHENLVERRAVTELPAHRPRDLYDWARTVGLGAQTSTSDALSGDTVIDLFNKVMVEQYSRLPFLRKRVFEAFCTDGELIVSGTVGVSSSYKSIPIVSLLRDTPRSFFDLLEQKRAGLIRIEYYIDIDIVLTLMEVRSLCGSTHATTDDESDRWTTERNIALEAVARKLIAMSKSCIHTALQRAAQTALERTCCEKLAAFCAEGPYEPSQLCLEAYDDARRTWEAEWNIAEALPVHNDAPKTSLSLRPVCAAYRGENGVTCFTVIDANAMVMGHTRWIDCDLSTPDGRQQNEKQLMDLTYLIKKHSPCVIGVAAIHPETQRLMVTLEKLVFERLHGQLQVHIPVVWVSSLAAQVVSHSSEMIRAAGTTMDTVTRTSVCVARYLQNPLFQICQLFDEQQSVLKLPIGCHYGSSSIQPRKLVSALQWEVSLWVAACGVDLQQVLRLPMPTTVLQFVPGLGPRKAQVLCEALRERPVFHRRGMSDLLEDCFSRSVERNATPSIRHRPPPEDDDDASAERYHPLDITIVEPGWYGRVEEIAHLALKGDVRSDEEDDEDGNRRQRDEEVDAFPSRDELFASLIIFMMLPEAEQRKLIGKTVDIEALALSWKYAESEVLLMVHELYNGGRSFMRRPFRILSNKMLFKLLTGINFIPRSDFDQLPQHQQREHPLVIYEGQVVQGTVAGVKGGSVVGIRVATTRGVAGFISMEDIEEDVMKTELQEWNMHMEDVRGARDRGEPAPPRKECPQWLTRGAVIHGTVTGCMYERCELRLRWCFVADTVGEPLNGGGQGDGALGGMALDQRSMNSVLTQQIIDEARINILKIARHDLFRGVTAQNIAAQLSDKCIGECLIRPTRHGKHNETIICVKIGQHSIANWPVREVRTSSGQVAYEIHDKRVQRTYKYHDVDHCLDTFVKHAVEKAVTIRKHRRFISDSREINKRLDEDQRLGGYKTVYCFAEVEDEERPQTFYKIFYRIGDKPRTYNLKLHIDCNHIHVRLPIISTTDTAASSSRRYEWVACGNAEAASAVLKAFVDSGARKWIKAQQLRTSRR